MAQEKRRTYHYLTFLDIKMAQETKSPLNLPSEIIEMTLNHEEHQYSIAIPKNEQFRVREIFSENGYSIPGFRDIKNATIIDIGANVGLFAMYAKLNCPDARIDCYEPASNVCELFKKNTSQMDGIHLHKRGVSNFTGRTKIFLSGLNTGATSIKSIGGHQALGEETIKLVEARSIVENKEKIDILKIDTEGCELEIIENLKEHDLLKKITFVMLEYHSESDRRKIDQLMTDFTLFGSSAIVVNCGTLKYVRTELLGTQICSQIHVATAL